MHAGASRSAAAEPGGVRRRLAVAALLAAAAVAPPASRAAVTDLPAPRLDGTFALERALAQRRSLRAFGDPPLTLAEAGQLLWAAQGVSDPAQGRRTAPSAGATYPLTLFLVAGRVDGVAAGVHRYDPASHRLAPTVGGDARAAIAAAARGQGWLRDAPALVVIAARPARTAARYGGRTERYVAIEAGAAAQNLLLQAVALGLGGTIVGAFDDAALRRLLALGEGEPPLAIVAVGRAR